MCCGKREGRMHGLGKSLKRRHRFLEYQQKRHLSSSMGAPPQSSGICMIKDTSTGKRHRFSLGNQCRGIDGKREAVIEGGKRYISYMAKMERGEQLRSLSTGEMCRRFLEKEKGRISNVPHKGITQTRYRFLENHVDKFLEFVGGANIDVTKIRRERLSLLSRIAKRVGTKEKEA